MLNSLIVGTSSAVERAKRAVQRHARVAIAAKRALATQETRAIVRAREGEMLVRVLREEMAAFHAAHSPAVGGSAHQPLAFTVNVTLPSGVDPRPKTLNAKP